jgi:hypothetical protein
MRALVVSAVGTVALAFVALACTRGDGVDRAFLEAPCTNDATAEAFTPVPFERPSPDETMTTGPLYRPDTERECRIRRALLTPEDLPGWQQGSRVERDAPWGLGCEFGVSAPPDTLDMWFDHDIEGDRRGVARQHVIAVEEGRGDYLMAGLRHSCRKLMTDGDSRLSGTSWIELSVPSVGDDAVAIELAFDDDEDGSSSMRSVTIRRGDVFSVLFVTGPEGIADIGAIARRMATKLDLVGPLPAVATVPLMDGECLPPAETPVPAAESPILERALIELEELPRGWSRVSPNRCVTLEIQRFDCPDGFRDDEAEQYPRAHVAFERAHFGVVSHRITLLPLGEGAAVFERHRLTEAVECTVTTNVGRAPARYAPVDFRDVGDGAFAYTAVLELEDAFDQRLTAVEWRHGDVVIGVYFSAAPFATVSEDGVLRLLADIVDAADAKFAAAADELNALPR